MQKKVVYGEPYLSASYLVFEQGYVVAPEVRRAC